MCLTCTGKRAVWAKSEVNLAESGTGKVVLKIGVDQPMGGGSDPGKLAERVCGFTCVGAFARKRVSFHRVKRVSRQVWRRNCFHTSGSLFACFLLACVIACTSQRLIEWSKRIANLNVQEDLRKHRGRFAHPRNCLPSTCAVLVRILSNVSML